MRTIALYAGAASLLLVSSTGSGHAAEKAKAPTTAAAPAAAPNTLTKAEKAAGWKLLFDGKTTKGWRGFRDTKFPETAWSVVDGTIKHDKGVKSADIVTEEEFDSFELRGEFRLAEGSNSGIKYLVDESVGKEGSKQGVAFEFQVLDDDKHPDAKKGKPGTRTVGALYDIIAPAADKVVKPIGAWNEMRLLVEGNHVEHWLNGGKVVEYDRGSDAFKALIAESKFKDIAGFGQWPKGRILLQDHNDEVSFRSLKIRKITRTKTAALR